MLSCVEDADNMVEVVARYLRSCTLPKKLACTLGDRALAIQTLGEAQESNKSKSLNCLQLDSQGEQGIL
jgi:hypothetical protein